MSSEWWVVHDESGKVHDERGKVHREGAVTPADPCQRLELSHQRVHVVQLSTATTATSASKIAASSTASTATSTTAVTLQQRLLVWKGEDSCRALPYTDLSTLSGPRAWGCGVREARQEAGAICRSQNAADLGHTCKVIELQEPWQLG